jgi:hypothetical protein
MTSAAERETLSGISAEAYKSMLRRTNFNYDYLSSQRYKEEKAYHDVVLSFAKRDAEFMKLYLEARSAA